MEKMPHIRAQILGKTEESRHLQMLSLKNQPNQTQLKPNQPRVKKVWDLPTAAEPHLHRSSRGGSAEQLEDFQQQQQQHSPVQEVFCALAPGLEP